MQVTVALPHPTAAASAALQRGASCRTPKPIEPSPSCASAAATSRAAPAAPPPAGRSFSTTSAGAFSTKSGLAELRLDAAQLLLDLAEIALKPLAHGRRIDDAAQRHEDLAQPGDDRRRLARAAVARRRAARPRSTLRQRLDETLDRAHRLAGAVGRDAHAQRGVLGAMPSSARMLRIAVTASIIWPIARLRLGVAPARRSPADTARS